MSNAKAKYVSLSTCCAQVIWMGTQLLDYGFRYTKIPIYCDSQSTIAISCNPVQHSGTKHINIHYHFIKDHVEKDTIELYFVGTEYQLADLFTKALPKERFEYLVHRIDFIQLGDATNTRCCRSIPCSLKCNIIRIILLDNPLNYALNSTADVPTVYLQQFWRTVSKVLSPEDTIKFMLITQEFIYTVDMFRDILHLLEETLENPFVAPVNIETMEAFMNRVFNLCLTTRTSGHDQTKINILQIFHAVINRTNVDYAALLWWDFMNNVNQKKEAIQYPRFIKLIIAILLGMCLYEGMLIPNAFLTEEIRATDDFKEYEMVFMNVDVPMNQPQSVVSTQGMHRSTPRAYMTPTLTASRQGNKRKKIVRESSSPHKSLKITIRQQKVVNGEKVDDDFMDRLEPGSHKDNPEHVDDDDDKDDEKVDEEEGGEMGSLETRTEEMQTPIPIKPISPTTILSSDKNITQELTNTVPIPTKTSSNTPHFKRHISSKYCHLPGALRRMCKRQGYMIQNMEQKCATTKQFWKTHKQVNQVLHQGVSQLAKKVIKDLIKNNLKPCITTTIIEDHDAFHSEVPDLVFQEFNAQAPMIIEELFKNYIQSNVI
ncbi:hypothetical protein Tco_1070716 [Tanacetum coccineum]|uniref:Uncharacterized protein n=1 Tax=Tanacetum coccineum TaxID=301880 RepID=A0ABQ5HNC0_9ASTR